MRFPRFFDFYGPGFIPAWVALVDGAVFTPPPPIPGGFVISVFGEVWIDEKQREAAIEQGVRVDLDTHTADRSAILRCSDKAAGLEVLRRLTGRTRP